MEYIAEEITSSEENIEGTNERQAQIMRYVEDYFREEGASAFSSKIAIGFLQVTRNFTTYISFP